MYSWYCQPGSLPTARGKGLAESLEELADEPDTVLAVYAPPCMAQRLQWHGDRLDAAATIVAMMGNCGRLVTFGAYTAELEADIAKALSSMECS